MNHQPGDGIQRAPRDTTRKPRTSEREITEEEKREREHGRGESCAVLCCGYEPRDFQWTALLRNVAVAWRLGLSRALSLSYHACTGIDTVYAPLRVSTLPLQPCSSPTPQPTKPFQTDQCFRLPISSPFLIFLPFSRIPQPHEGE